MAKVNWKEILGWSDEHLNELRFSGFSFLREGLYNKALLFFEALKILSPGNPYDLQTLGAIYLQIGENQKALDALNAALELVPAHEPSLLNKAKALFCLGKHAEGLSLVVTLQKSGDAAISSDASALVLSYQ